MTYPTGEMRATIFTSPIAYDANNLKRVGELLPEDDGFIPNQVPAVQLIPGLNVPVPTGGMPTEWELFSAKKQLRIHFGPQKIDVIKNTFKQEESVGYESILCKWALDFFIRIIERFSLTPTRLAFAPTYTPDWTKEFSRAMFNESVYNKAPFKSSSFANLLFKQVFRVNERLGDREVLFNYVAEASEGQNLIEAPDKKSITVKQMLNLSLDINTFQAHGYVFSMNEVIDFFNKAPKYAEDFLAYYAI